MSSSPNAGNKSGSIKSPRGSPTSGLLSGVSPGGSRPPLSPTVGISRSPVPFVIRSPAASGSPSISNSISARNSSLRDVEIDTGETGSSRSRKDPADLEEDEFIANSIYRFPKDAPTAISTLTNILLITILTLTPGILLVLGGTFPTYQLWRIKSGELSVNFPMEFVRICTICWLAMVTLLLSEWICYTLPIFIMRFIAALGISLGPSLKRQVAYCYGARRGLCAIVWISCLAAIGSTYLYHQKTSEILQKSLMNTLNGNAAFGNTSIRSILKMHIGPTPTLVESLLIFLILWFLLQAVVRFIVYLVTRNFQKQAFGDRVSNSNWSFRVIRNLAHAVRKPTEVVLPIRLEDNIKADRELALLDDFNFIMKDVEILAQELTKALLPEASVMGISILEVTEEHLRPFFVIDQVSKVFSAIDIKGRGKVTPDDLKTAILAISKEREQIISNMRNNRELIRKLEILLFGVIFVLIIFIAVPVFGISIKMTALIFCLVWLCLGYLFQEPAKKSLDSLMFIFGEHVFDHGDLIVIDGEAMYVEHIELMTTTLRRWDGATVVMSNSVLSTMPIMNIRRSGPQSETINLVIGGTTPLASIYDLRDELAKYCKSLPSDFTGKVDIVKYAKDTAASGSDKLAKVSLCVEHATNFQDSALKAARHKLLKSQIQNLITELKLDSFS